MEASRASLLGLDGSAGDERSQPVASVRRIPLPVDAFLATQFHVLTLPFSPEESGPLAEQSQRTQLLGSQYTSNPYFTQHSEANRGRLGGSEITQTLFDHVLVRVISVQCFVESLVRFAQTLIDQRSFGLQLLPDCANLLTLLRAKV